MVSVQFRKKIKGLSFYGGWSKNLKLSPDTCFGVSFKKNVLPSFLLFLSVYYYNDLSDSEKNETASSTARNFNNSSLLCQTFRNNKPLSKYLTDGNLKMLAVFIFEIKDTKKAKIFNFL